MIAKGWAMVNAAKDLAFETHCHQLDKAGEPYIGHPIRIVTSLFEAGYGALPIAVAWLHDVVEDSDGRVTLERLQMMGFPEAVVEGVDAITRREGEQPSEYYARVKANQLAYVVKYYDIKDNSDPKRLAALDEATRDRLMKKYTKAVEEIGYHSIG